MLTKGWPIDHTGRKDTAMVTERNHLTQIRITTEPIESFDGSSCIPKGKLVIVTKRTPASGYEVTTLSGKTTIGIGNRLTSLSACPLTCKENELLYMELRTDYHTYSAFGRNTVEMYKKIVWMYNRNASSSYTTANIFRQEYFDEYHCFVWKVDSNLTWFDDEYQSFNESNPTKASRIGDWFSLYRKSTMFGKDYFNKTMK
jgi:hypothetical protein